MTDSIVRLYFVRLFFSIFFSVLSLQIFYVPGIVPDVGYVFEITVTSVKMSKVGNLRVSNRVLFSSNLIVVVFLVNCERGQVSCGSN